MAELSVIIPTLNAGPTLADCLAAVAGGQRAGAVEVIVADGGSTDATAGIAAAAGATLVSGRPGRGRQLATGAAAAGGAWLLFLHADSALPDTWQDAVQAHVDRGQGAACFRLAFRAGGWQPRLVAGWANLRSRLGLPYGDQGLLIPRALYDAVGGYPAIDLMEDVWMARALKGRIRLLEATITTGAERYLSEGWFRRGTRNFWTLARYLAGADPALLARRYRDRR